MTKLELPPLSSAYTSSGAGGVSTSTSLSLDGSSVTPLLTCSIFFLKLEPHVADHVNMSDKAVAKRMLSTCLTRTQNISCYMDQRSIGQ